MGLEVKPPDVNGSFARFTPVAGEHAIRYGLAGIKGVGGGVADAIVSEREKNGPYKGFMDFCLRLGSVATVGADGKRSAPLLNKRAVESLARCGAFDSFIAADPSLHRARLFNNVEFALKRANGMAKEKASIHISRSISTLVLIGILVMVILPMAIIVRSMVLSISRAIL